jgi:hypothetical protein
MLRRLAVPALLFFAAASAACGPPRHSADDYLQVASQIVAFAEEDARENAPGARPGGPLLLDLRTLVHYSGAITGETLPPDTVARALDREFRSAGIEEVLLCDEEGPGGCWVREYGVYLQVNNVRGSGDRMRALVRTITTDRRMFPTNFCNRYWQLDFQRVDGDWRIADANLNRSCV